MSEASNQNVKIQGVEFVAPAPYEEGHTLNTAEAAVLNQTLAENLRNNFAAQVKAAKEQHGENLPDSVLAELQVAFSKYADDYEFHGRRVSRAPVDPVRKEALKMARAIVMGALRANKIDTKSLPEGKVEELVEAVLAKKPEIMDEAKRRVESAKSIASDALEGLV